MFRFTKKRLFVMLPVLTALVVAVLASAAMAATSTFGNAAIDREYVDIFSAFTVVDTAATAPNDGVITTLDYYAKNTNSFRFVLIDSVSSKKVLWVSNDITPSGVGAATFTPASPVPVHAGNLVGIYSDSTGVIPFTLNGSAFEGSGSDLFTYYSRPVPTTGEVIQFDGITDRDYSYNANFDTNYQAPPACSGVIGQPIDSDGSSVFKAKKGAIPVKLTGCDNPNLAPQISINRTSGLTPGPVDEINSLSSADSGTTMRFSPTDHQYIYNLAASNLGVGTYKLTITVGDQTVATATFKLG